MAMDELDAKVEELRKRAEHLRPKYDEVTFKSFLEETPPETYVHLIDLKPGSEGAGGIETPDLALFCENEICSGLRIFRCGSDLYGSQDWTYTFLTYTCRNCASSVVWFAISHNMGKTPTGTSVGRATCVKLGQIPAFGPKTPARLITLIGPDKDIFLQGRRAENRGLGIGAFLIIDELSRIKRTELSRKFQELRNSWEVRQRLTHFLRPQSMRRGSKSQWKWLRMSSRNR
jgi:hypothetical protein